MALRRTTLSMATVLLAISVASEPCLAAACMTAAAGDMGAEGEVAKQEFKGAGGKSDVVYILKLPIPACLSGRDKRDNVRESDAIQLISSRPDIMSSIEQSVGKTSLVYGKPRGARSSRDHAPIVMDVTKIDSE